MFASQCPNLRETVNFVPKRYNYKLTMYAIKFQTYEVIHVALYTVKFFV